MKWKRDEMKYFLAIKSTYAILPRLQSPEADEELFRYLKDFLFGHVQAHS